jgi:hypothetical protein
MILLAKEIDGSIHRRGTTPSILSALPAEGLVEKSVRFFHSAMILNRQYFIAEKNILHLNKQTDCLLAKYNQDDLSAYLLLIRYRNDEPAQTAYLSFLNAYMPEAKTSGMLQLENRTWTMIKHHRHFLILILEASQKQFGMNLLTKVKP